MDVIFLEMDIDTLIESDLSWRDIIYEIIKDMDPWNIDIAGLSIRYSKKVDSMEEMNFKIPANVVIVSSVLLRIKSDIFNPNANDNTSEVKDSLNFMFGSEFPQADASLGGNGQFDVPIVLKPSRVITRRITAMELIQAIQDALEEKTTKTIMKAVKDKNGKTTLVITTNIDIKKLIEETYSRVIELLAQKEFILFSELAKTKDEILTVFIPLLHLSNRQKLKLRQEKIFGEIYIHPAHNISYSS